jgi:hypothetical protein
MILKQILYLGHWIIKLERVKFYSCLNYAQKKSNKTRANIVLDIMYCVLKFKISIMEYFQFNFFQIGKEERANYVGTPFLEEYLIKMNPKSERHLLDNKLILIKTYAPFFKRSYATLTDLQANNDSVTKVLHNKSGKIVLKWMYGECGKRIEVLPVKGLDAQAIINYLSATGNDFIEECIIQHRDLMNLSPSGVNTLRIITQLNINDEVEILGTCLRISINSFIDNMSAGNIAAPVNTLTGVIEGPGVYFDITKPDEYNHPVTGVQIIGYKIPYWKESLQMAKDAALYNKKNRSIGWDIAVTDNGPDLVEGNLNWGKQLWQMPVKRGLKHLLFPQSRYVLSNSTENRVCLGDSPALFGQKENDNKYFAPKTMIRSLKV